MATSPKVARVQSTTARTCGVSFTRSKNPLWSISQTQCRRKAKSAILRSGRSSQRLLFSSHSPLGR